MPLVFAGAHLGGRAEPLAYPTKTNLIPRSIPPQAWYMQPAFAVLVGGVLPFGAVFIELFFILSSVWLHQYYYVCLLYTSPSPRDRTRSRMPSSA